MMISRSVGVHERKHPRARLQQVRDDVAVEQHRALRDAGRAAGVLQERDVVVAERHALQRPLAAVHQRVGQADRAGHRVRRHHLLHAPDHQVDEHALQAEQLADRRDDRLAHLGLADHFLQHVREVLDDDDDLGAGVDELMLELARRVERIDVDHRAAGPQDAEQAHRILQDVRHHQRDARALLAALRLAGTRRTPTTGGRAPRSSSSGPCR